MLPIRDNNPSPHFPIVTFLLIFANIFVFLLELLTPDIDLLIKEYALIPKELNFFELNSLSTLISSQFLHAGFIHILSNMWFLWIFGDNLESDWGHLKFLFFYLGSGIVAGLTQYLVNPTSPIPIIGASGAVAGVLGGYLVFHPYAKIQTLIVTFGGFLTTIDLPAYLMLVYWFFSQFFAGTASIFVGTQTGGVAFFAHVGGFITGYALSKFKKQLEENFDF